VGPEGEVKKIVVPCGDLIIGEDPTHKAATDEKKVVKKKSKVEVWETFLRTIG